MKVFFMLPGLLGLVLAASSCKKSDRIDEDPIVVVVSMDGFRWDYCKHAATPHFDKLAETGVRASRMIPSFPTKTFPNHYSLVTGLFPDKHGIINNTFFASDLGDLYRIRNREMVKNGACYFGEPIWVSAEKQGILTAPYFWVGSEAVIGGIRPSYQYFYDGNVPYSDRIETILKLLALPAEKRPGLLMLYFDEPDAVGHRYGPDARETRLVIEEMDALLGELMEGLDALPCAAQINLIVLSDHGMASISPERYVNIYDHVDTVLIDDLYGGNPVYLIDAAEGMADSVAGLLNAVHGLGAWAEADIPAHLHYGSHPRFPDVLVLADSLWSVGTHSDASAYRGGAHGYDPRFTRMHTIFFAKGPAFRSDGFVHPPFSNVEVYGMLCHILGIEAAANDGDLDRVMDLFAPEE